MNLYFSKVIFYTIMNKNRICPKDHSKINVKGTYIYTENVDICYVFVYICRYEQIYKVIVHKE